MPSKEKTSQCVLYLIGKDIPGDLVETLAKYKFDLDIYANVITKELVDSCHAVGAKVNVWTVDDVELAERLVGFGVDFITTNIIE